MSTALHWFRRDLRLNDNTALNAAVAAHDRVVTVYIASEWRTEHRWTGAPRQEFLCGSLAALAKELEKKGGQLIVRRGAADQVLAKLLRETGADAVYFNRDPDPFGRAMEKKVEKLGVAVHGYKDHALHERDEALTGSGTPFKVFTPFAKAWRKLAKPPPGHAVARFAPPPKLPSDPLPTLATWGLYRDSKIIEPGEAAARRRLGRFLDGPVKRYAQVRDLPGEEATSRLSQDLRFGLLSIREVYALCREAATGAALAEQRSVEVFINELIWREFYMAVLWHWPEVLKHEWNERYRGLTWSRAAKAFERWREGQTGFPIVDAGMRQLAATGFMHNRIRMVVAMFLTKDLHLDWRLGERWFMQRLTDGEIASNNGGWQWSASTGTDAAPYFRIQNPWTQAKRFDPGGTYIRRWVPELRDVPGACLFRPPDERLAKGYPLPMVDHRKERNIALALYRRA